MPQANKPTIKEIERACRMYKSNQQAAKALGISSTKLSIVCKENNIQRPSEKK